MKQIVFVVSMHRSGSSLLTKGLECCGVSLGNNLMAEGPDNLKGFFEDERISELNEHILTIMDYQWSLLGISPQNLNEFQLKDLEKKAQDLIFQKQDESGNETIIGIKDPRFCRLAFFWFSICDKHSIPYKVIFLVRDPNEVAQSLKKRNDMSLIGGYALWLDYMSSALGQLREVETLLIRLDEFCGDISGHINAVGNFLGSKVNPETLAEYIDVFYKKGMIHEADDRGFITSSVWNYLKNCQSGKYFSIESIDELKKICEAEKKSEISLKGYIAQLNWHRDAESQALRKEIYARDLKINALEAMIKKMKLDLLDLLEKEYDVVFQLKSILKYIK